MLSRFINWIRNNVAVLEEGVFGSSWNYRLPEDKKQQMYDFYMMEFLLPRTRVGLYTTPLDSGGYDVDKEREEEDKYLANKDPLTPYMKTIDLSSNPQGKTGEMKRTNEDKFDYALYEALGKILPNLKRELLEVVNFSLAAELRHIYDDSHHTMNVHTGNNAPPQQLIKKVTEALGPEYGLLIKKYTLNMINSNDPAVKDLVDRSPISSNLKTSSSNYKSSYRAMKAVGGTDEQWATLCKWLFVNAKWNGSYGGAAWAGIANGWLELYHAEAPHDVITYIDHIYDLEHNTGSVFTKVKSYQKENSGYEWVKEALDHKRYLVSPHEMIEHVSPSMRELALMGIKIRTGKTWGDFEKDWPDIVKQKTLIYNQTQLYQWEKEKEKKMKKYGYFHTPKPTPLTTEAFAAQMLNPSKNTYSLHQVHKRSLVKPDQKGATKDIPPIDKIKIGDEVSLEWPPHKWHTVLAVKPKSGEIHKYWGEMPDTLVLDSEGTTPLVNIHGYRPKAAKPVAPSPIENPIWNDPGDAPKPPKPTPQPGVFKDAVGKEIKIGDTVKKQVTSLSHNGIAKKLNPDGTVDVQWPTYNKTYAAAELIVIKSSTLSQTAVKDAYGHPLKVGDNVKAVMGSGMAGLQGKITGFFANEIMIEKPDGATFHAPAKDFAWLVDAAAAIAPSPTAPVPSSIIYKDFYGTKININDKVQNQWTPYKKGKIVSLLPNGDITVAYDDGENKKISPKSIVVIAGTVAAHNYKDVQNKEIKNGDNVQQIVPPFKNGTVTGLNNGMVLVKWYGAFSSETYDSHNLKIKPIPAPTPVAPVAPAPTAPAYQPKPEGGKEDINQKAKNIYESLPKMSKHLKIARTIRGMLVGVGLPIITQQTFTTLEAVLNIKIEPSEEEEIRKSFKKEGSAIHYYESRKMNYPSNLTAEQAWDQIQTKFPDAPHVYIDADTEKKIIDLLMQKDGDYEATKIVRNVTQFQLAAAKGLTILKKLELYADNKIKD